MYARGREFLCPSLAPPPHTNTHAHAHARAHTHTLTHTHTGQPATEEELIEWGGKLGSDVSFFLSRGTAYCTGRGEIIEARDFAEVK